MKINHSLLVSVAFMLVAGLVAAWLWPTLPARVPVHWNLHGQVDGHAPRLWAALFPVLGVGLLAFLTWLLPAISPRRFGIRPFAAVYAGLMLVGQGFVLVLGVVGLLAAAGYAVSVPQVAVLGVGALYVILGNYMGKLRRNFFIGIRTPWTLASEATWERTHRLGGRLFVLGGLIVWLAALSGLPLPVALVVLLAAGLYPVGYSYVIYRRLEAAGPD